MKITSPSFQEGGTIPEKFSKNGQNVSPELRIQDAPAEAKSLALIVDDPDAPVGLVTHWLVWNIDPKTTEIAKGSAPSGAVQGKAITARSVIADHIRRRERTVIISNFRARPNT
jgi:hypothetical protein